MIRSKTLVDVNGGVHHGSKEILAGVNGGIHHPCPPVFSEIGLSIQFAQRNGRRLKQVLVGRREWAQILKARPPHAYLGWHVRIYGIPVRPFVPA